MGSVPFPSSINEGANCTHYCRRLARVWWLAILGDTLKFNILHEDWGDGELPTFYKHVTCHVGWNELRCTTAADHQPPPPPRSRPRGFIPGFSLTGPIAIEATAGNGWPE
jgi:hypothetical protein